ncbi:MAG: phenylalanine--tRNA ligase subunit beta, partial [Clostridia bacterium]
MLIPLNWLKEYVDIDDLTIGELSDKLISCGFEIEGVVDLSAKIENVAVGKILSLEQHPNADRLQVCKIDAGEKGLLQIVTGATNIKIGDLVPVALDGALLPSGQTITRGALRGVSSDGMLCGGSELALTEN